ncbi:MAG: KpsF/GutQ family sugar-phosphate isomerase [Pseudomonadota bacterium]|nr:KpsF/GutQ family sugar-phosphate isomerase [Pseudomonadota bacterium]
MTEHDDDAIIAAGREVLDEGAAWLNAASRALGADFAAAARALAEPHSFTTVIGVGKSGYIGRKFAASLLSTGHGAAFLHPTDALHGDLGIADHSTLAILLSHSGNTEELVTLIPMIRQFGVNSALISQGRDCALASDVDWIIETTVAEEAGIGRLAPTSSSTTTLALCDALMMASLTIRDFTAEAFRRYHPGGMLGQKMRRVGDEMLPLERLTWVAPDTGIYDVMEQISAGGQGFSIVSERPKGPGVRPDDVGFITDGDIRRAAQDQDGFNAMTAASIMSSSPLSVPANAFAIEALRIMEQRAILSLLCTDDDGTIVGAVHIHGIVARELGLEPARGQAPG